MDKTFKLTDEAIAHIVKLLQIGLLEGTDITDHFRRITLESDDEGQLYLSEDYLSSFNRSLEKMEEFIKEQSDQEDKGE
tara:strand:+ start:2209 stop:2445 length:237 start_codon:yes stop_codon:yes gene_type:complete